MEGVVIIYGCGECGAVGTREAWDAATESELRRTGADPGGWHDEEVMVCPACGHVHHDNDGTGVHGIT